MIAISIPFRIEGGRITTTTDVDRIVRQKIVDVLATRLFERPTNPRYGARTYSLLFDNFDMRPDDPEFADFKVDAIREINERVSNVKTLDMVINQLEESTYRIVVYYSTPMSSISTLSFEIRSPEALTEDTPLIEETPVL